MTCCLELFWPLGPYLYIKKSRTPFAPHTLSRKTHCRFVIEFPPSE